MLQKRGDSPINKKKTYKNGKKKNEEENDELTDAFTMDFLVQSF